MLRDFNDHRFNVILKARQLGISTTTAAYVAWMMMFHRNKNILVIATGTSSRHVSSISEHLIDEFKKFGVIGIKPEGLTRGDWVLIDGGDIIVHIFRDEVRQFYNLEKLWGSSASQNNKNF